MTQYIVNSDNEALIGKLVDRAEELFGYEFVEQHKIREYLVSLVGVPIDDIDPVETAKTLALDIRALPTGASMIGPATSELPPGIFINGMYVSNFETYDRRMIAEDGIEYIVNSDRLWWPLNSPSIGGVPVSEEMQDRVNDCVRGLTPIQQAD